MAIDVTVTGTQVTVPQMTIGLRYPAVEFAVLKQL